MKVIRKRIITKVRKQRFVEQRSLEFQAILVGGLAGLAGVFFQLGIAQVAFQKKQLAFNISQWAMPSWFWSGVLSMFMLLISLALVRYFSPESSGSGIHEIEGYLGGSRPAIWQRVLPVKFFGGILALGSGMILGREGPSVQMGGNCGAMVNHFANHDRQDTGHALLSAGAAAGLAAAFNAPLAGMIFIMEEMRTPFHYNFFNIRLIAIATLIATLITHIFIDEPVALPSPVYAMPAWHEMFLYLIMGAVIGIAGALLNRGIILGLKWMDALKENPKYIYSFIAFLGFFIGILNFFQPDLIGNNYQLVKQSLGGSIAIQGLALIILIRFFFSIVCFCSGVPGGIFAPMIVLGTLLGLWCGHLAAIVAPEITQNPYPFAIAGMGALFAATVQAPITGIVLVVEMTSNYSLIVPIMIACVGADILAHELGTRPLYSVLLKRQLNKAKRQ
ncbi:MAG: H(+)/Cl(-) exchange transporter ClcA [Gammaproteobacteria bacterium CG22_combo_CG10-13_8_21_14_all_40_8]|nr:MAG: H(+)/Cl(-) exchange transporter ClcA [Gammaproteobacteria bacterium CG22_combo_CG10-13_8_21_14_all_40_8]